MFDTSLNSSTNISDQSSVLIADNASNTEPDVTSQTVFSNTLTHESNALGDTLTVDNSLTTSVSDDNNSGSLGITHTTRDGDNGFKFNAQAKLGLSDNVSVEAGAELVDPHLSSSSQQGTLGINYDDGAVSGGITKTIREGDDGLSIRAGTEISVSDDIKARFGVEIVDPNLDTKQVTGSAGIDYKDTSLSGQVSTSDSFRIDLNQKLSDDQSLFSNYENNAGAETFRVGVTSQLEL